MTDPPVTVDGHIHKEKRERKKNKRETKKI